MRTVRAFYNKAMKAGLVNKDLYSFTDYKIKTTQTEKRALDCKFINQIIELKLKPGHVCFNARNYFLASYIMYGINFSDMANLKKSDIVNGPINYRRRKTSKLYDIKVTENSLSILSHYMSANPTSEYVFPIVKRLTAQEQEKNV